MALVDLPQVDLLNFAIHNTKNRDKKNTAPAPTGPHRGKISCEGLCVGYKILYQFVKIINGKGETVQFG